MSPRLPPSFASGDPIADRRAWFARGLAEAGDLAAAADVLAQALEIAPHWAAGWLLLGEWREQCGYEEGATDAYRAARRLDPDDRLGAGLRLAVRSGRTPEAMPTAYVRTLFDDYAPRFEAALTERLDYRGPELIATALGPDRTFAATIDLGCGTGLMGAAIRGRTARLSGVDLSEGMIARAARKGVYDRLLAAEVLAFLAGEPESGADLVLAADLVPYFGDLAPLFAGVARALVPGGLFAFTAERHDGDGFVLGERLRYRHAVPEIAGMAAKAGLDVGLIETAVIRLDGGKPVEGLVCRLARAAGSMPVEPAPEGGPVLPLAA